MSKPKKYKTGDVVTKRKEWGYIDDYKMWEYGLKQPVKWAIVGDLGLAVIVSSRRYARLHRLPGERIARVIKETPKTVTVVISK